MNGLSLLLFSVILGVGSLSASATVKPKKVSLAALQSVRVDDSGRLSLKFNKPLKQIRMKTDLLPGKIQFSFEDVFLRQAELFRFEHAPIHKVFVYQFTPKIVRLRLFTELPTESVMSKLAVNQEGSSLTIPLGTWIEPVVEAVPEVEAYKEQNIQEVEKLEKDLEKRMQESVKSVDSKSGLVGSIRLWTSILSFTLLGFGVLILVLSRRKRGVSLQETLPETLGATLEDSWCEVLSKKALTRGTEIWLVRIQTKVVALLVSQKSYQVLTEYEADAGSFESEAQVELPTLESKAPWQPSKQLRQRIHSRLEGLKPL